MFSIESCPLPDEALLNTYVGNGAYTDCYRTEISGAVTHAEYVNAFYTTTVFKLERMILKWAVSRPSCDAQARQLAEGAIDKFAAWHVESKREDQLLMCDFQGRTRSWFMVIPIGFGGNRKTQLYFGSAVTPVQSLKTGMSTLGFGFTALLGFHKITLKYSCTPPSPVLKCNFARIEIDPEYSFEKIPHNNRMQTDAAEPRR